MITICTFIVGCGVLSSCAPAIKDDGKIRIVATIFPEYDWTINILGEKKDNAEITLLLDSGVDLHNFQPTVSDVATISSCDLFIYVGGESDEWVDDALKTAVNKNMTVISLLDVLGDKVKEEEVVEGMEGAEGEGLEYDEHVWLSLKNARVFTSAIASALGKIDPDNAAYYAQNAESYNAKLVELDERYGSSINASAKKTVLFGDRFPFRYLADDYGLTYYAAFSGCSAETEAGFETIAFLAQKLDELGLSTILKIESSKNNIAQAIKNNTADKNQKILTMDSLQSLTLRDYNSGKRYLTVMESNLNVLVEALA